MPMPVLKIAMCKRHALRFTKHTNCHNSRRFVMGSNKMLQVALGKSESDELRTNLSVIASRLKGHSGLFFTKLPREEVSYVKLLLLLAV